MNTNIKTIIDISKFLIGFMCVPSHVIIIILIGFYKLLVIPSIRRTYSRGVIPLGRYYGVPILVLTNRATFGSTKCLLIKLLDEHSTTPSTYGLLTDFLALSDFICFFDCHIQIFSIQLIHFYSIHLTFHKPSLS